VSARAAWARALALGAGVIGLDQALKALVRAAIAPGEAERLALGFRLVHVQNKGVAFGALGGGGGVVLAVTLVALAAVAIWFAREPARPYLWLGAGLLAGGAIGNLADRIRLGSVTDYLDPPLWPAFNLADATITAGAIVLVLVSLSPRPEGEATGSARR